MTPKTEAELQAVLERLGYEFPEDSLFRLVPVKKRLQGAAPRCNICERVYGLSRNESPRLLAFWGVKKDTPRPTPKMITVCLDMKACLQRAADAAEKADEEHRVNMKALLLEVELPTAEQLEGRSRPESELDHYYELHDGLSDMIEGGRLRVEDIPDDYAWLVNALAEIPRG